MNGHELINAHDSWADYYDCVYKLTYGEVYQTFTAQTLGVIGQLMAAPAWIVDFGAGTGRLAIPLAQLGHRVAAVEASVEMCRVLRAKAAAGVEGAVVTPCVVCHRSSVPAVQQHPVEVTLWNQSICTRLPDSGFDLGLCVFTVLNYLVEEMEIRQFASVAASSIRPGGKLLVSFVTDMAPMMRLFNGHPQSGESPDGRCSAVRNINIRPLQDDLYEYTEKSELTRHGNTIRYADRFRLRYWLRGQIMAAIEVAGFRMEDDLANTFLDTGETYLLFRRNPAKQKASNNRI